MLVYRDFDRLLVQSVLFCSSMSLINRNVAPAMRRRFEKQTQRQTMFLAAVPTQRRRHDPQISSRSRSRFQRQAPLVQSTGKIRTSRIALMEDIMIFPGSQTLAQNGTGARGFQKPLGYGLYRHATGAP